jgi:hypothetical protein
MTDASGLVPHSQAWLEYWDREVYKHMTDAGFSKGVILTIEAYRAVMKYMSNPASLVSGIPGIYD